jgi:hypothetical protein
VRRGENHYLPALTYNDKQMSLRFEIPCKVPIANVTRGADFLILVHAYGGTMEGAVELRFGIDAGTLWAQQAGSIRRVISDIRERVRQDREGS